MNATSAAARFSQALALIEQRLGLHFPPSRQEELAKLLAEAAAEAGEADIAGWVNRLEQGGLPDRTLEVLAQRLTVGETYFFREPATLAVLENHLLPQLVRRRKKGSRHLRLWSAGCCTGEEPYTLAMMLERLLPDIDDWNIHILATDLNQEFLDRAALGVYKDWSFRQIPPGIKDRFFRTTEAGCHVLNPRTRARVTFVQLNLAKDVYPSPVHDTGNMDVILCRNVLMYFSERQAHAAMTRLHRSLTPSGWLAVSPTEHTARRLPGLRSTHFDGVFLYRKTNDSDDTATPAASPSPHPVPRLPVPRSKPPHANVSSVRSTSRPSIDADPAPQTLSADTTALASRALLAANRGQLADALQDCDESILLDKMNPSLHFLRARVLQELDRQEETEAALRRVLYLEPTSIPAHFALGNLALRQGKKAEARRSFAHVLTLLQASPPDAELPDMDGLTVGHLTEMIHTLTRAVA